MDNFEQLKSMHQALFGAELKEIKDPDAVVGLLENKKTNIIMSLSWFGNGKTPLQKEHKIILKQLVDGRVVFYNPAGNDSGSTGDMVDDGNTPLRRIEGKNMESFSLSQFREFFKVPGTICFSDKLQQSNLVAIY